MSATHRGDMYHLRAAMQSENGKFSLVLYDTDWKDPKKRRTQDTEDYLARSTYRNGKTTFFVPWKKKKFLGNTVIDGDNLKNCYVDGAKLKEDADLYKMTDVTAIGEGDATERIRNAVNNAQDLERIREGMFLLQPKTKTYLDEIFDNIFDNTWGIKPDPNKTTILAMYRDTGKNPGGAYPEFDTGKGIEAIRTIAEKIPHDVEPQIRVLSCGRENESKEIGLGSYWTKLPKPNIVKQHCDTKDTEVTTRDIEAYFMYWGFQVKAYYQMAMGLRSGAFDLFTFMGIPTVSIGLRNMVGEDRHGKLVGKVFKRVNVQYDVPRHIATAYVAPSNPHSPDPLLSCPYWTQQPPRHKSTDSSKEPFPNRDPDLQKPENENLRDAARRQELANFSDFDQYVLEVGLKVAWHKYAKGPELVFSTNGDFPDVIPRHDARFCYRKDEQTDRKEKMLSRKTEDLSSIESMKSNLKDGHKTIRLTTELFDKFYLNPLGEDWKKIKEAGSVFK